MTAAHLQKFDFQYNEHVDTVFELKPYHALINRFTSQFWIERQWILEIEIKPYFLNKSGFILSRLDQDGTSYRSI